MKSPFLVQKGKKRVVYSIYISNSLVKVEVTYVPLEQRDRMWVILDPTVVAK